MSEDTSLNKSNNFTMYILLKKIGETVTDSMYEQGLDEALKVVVEFVESQKGNYTPNSTDMLSFNPAYENCDDRDDDDDYDYDVDDDYRGRW